MLHFSQIQNITFLQYSFRKLCTSFFSKYLHKDYYDWRKCELRAEIMTTEFTLEMDSSSIVRVILEVSEYSIDNLEKKILLFKLTNNIQ